MNLTGMISKCKVCGLRRGGAHPINHDACVKKLQAGVGTKHLERQRGGKLTADQIDYIARNYK